MDGVDLDTPFRLFSVEEKLVSDRFRINLVKEMKGEGTSTLEVIFELSCFRIRCQLGILTTEWIHRTNPLQGNRWFGNEDSRCSIYSEGSEGTHR